eukprot:m.129591 g.129591  ORF g.129591 m.129591 type:complete len:358 (+) comp22331_c0_seq2:207-1280(+)
MLGQILDSTPHSQWAVGLSPSALAVLGVWVALVVVAVAAGVTQVCQFRDAQCATTATAADGPKPTSVNYHFTRLCNYSCGFCFHTNSSPFVLPIDEQKRGLQLLANAGLKKLNLSGGEPFLIDKGERVGELARYAKETLKLESVTIVTNGSLVTSEWFEAYGRFLDILAVSCDSFDAETNTTIGRTFKNRDHLETLRDVCVWCHEHEVLFKLNTVVNTYNKAENMSEGVRSLGDICRWKIFQVLPITGENAGPGAIREVDKFLITDDEFQAFLQVHRDAGLADIMVDEDNAKMQNSYLILDERMRFLDCTEGGKKPSGSLLDVGVAAAMNQSGFDEAMFFKRGGEYKWSKDRSALEW